MKNPLYEQIENKWSDYIIKEGHIAKTILQQLGGNKFIAMTGAKNLADTGKGLSMRIWKNSKGINYVKIELTGSDLYNIEFGTIRKYDYTPKKKFKGIYVDQLGDIFTKATGMHIRL